MPKEEKTGTILTAQEVVVVRARSLEELIERLLGQDPAPVVKKSQPALESRAPRDPYLYD